MTTRTELAAPMTWQKRILAAHPDSNPEYWPDALKVTHMEAEILELRAALSTERLAGGGEPKPVGVLQEEALGRGCVFWFAKPPDGSNLYTTPPPQAERVPLSDEQPKIDAQWKVGPLTDELVLILGRPNFTCIRYAEMLRELGHAIPRKSEFEQAAVIHWMLGFYASHGEKWAEAAVEGMDAMRAARARGEGGV